MPNSSDGGEPNTAVHCDASSPESALSFGHCQSDALAELLYDHSSGSALHNSYALQLRRAREARQQDGNGRAVCSPRYGSLGLTPVAEAESSVGEWCSPHVICADAADEVICEQPRQDMFGGTYGTRPDFTPGELSGFFPSLFCASVQLLRSSKPVWLPCLELICVRACLPMLEGYQVEPGM
jgi:hypothetical protein